MLIRVGRAGRPAFQLRPGEAGISVFDEYGVDPPLTESEVLEVFRPESVAIPLVVEYVLNPGMTLVAIAGADALPDRLRAAHREIRPGAGMSRKEFKEQLKQLEPDGN